MGQLRGGKGRKVPCNPEHIRFIQRKLREGPFNEPGSIVRKILRCVQDDTPA